MDWIAINELRVANMILSDGEMDEVIAVNERDVRTKRHKSISTKRLSGVPITPKILLALGFAEYRTMDGSIFFNTIFCGDKDEDEEDIILEAYQSESDDGGEIWLVGLPFTPDKSHKKYAHELQNLFFGLAGADMTYDEEYSNSNGWMVYDNTDEGCEIHHIPLNDLMEHDVNGTNCRCKPQIKFGHFNIVTHNSFDGREVVEFAHQTLFDAEWKESKKS